MNRETKVLAVHLSFLFYLETLKNVTSAAERNFCKVEDRHAAEIRIGFLLLRCLL